MGYNKEKGKEIRTVHRLDRQTSGITFFAKTEEASNKFRELMVSNEIHKAYYARVIGDFRKCKGIENNEITVTNMIYCISNIDALWDCAEKEDVKFEYKTKAKESTTRIKFKFYDEKSD